jgi:hypothetical protein
MEYNPTLVVNSASSYVDKEDLEWMLREQIHAQQCEIKALRKALMYVHPVKELTDEEILNIAHQIRLIDRQTADDGHLYFARAILKKASEK